MASSSKRRIPMTVTFLEMNAKPAALPPPLPRGKVALLRCENPPVHFYRYLYDTIGEQIFLGGPQEIRRRPLAEVIHDPLQPAFCSVHGRKSGRHGRAGPAHRQAPPTSPISG